MTYCSIYYKLCKYHKTLIDSMILTIQRPIWKSKRKDHINMQQQAVTEVRRSAAKENRIHIQKVNWLWEVGTGPS